MENNQQYEFCALLSRMKYITRWGLMRSSRQETLSEHSAETAILAHMLALIARDVLHQPDIQPEKIAVSALYHDASEILTGDMPTPVKYKSQSLKEAYKALEEESARSLGRHLPTQLVPTMQAYLTAENLSAEEKKILKAADRLSALIKCIEEENSGNREFSSAKEQQMHQLWDMQCPAAVYFLEHFIPSYDKNLDELTRNMF